MREYLGLDKDISRQVLSSWLEPRGRVCLPLESPLTKYFAHANLIFITATKWSNVIDQYGIFYQQKHSTNNILLLLGLKSNMCCFQWNQASTLKCQQVNQTGEIP